MKKTILLLFIFSIILGSCNEKTQGIVNDLSFKKLIAKSDQLNIKLYDSTVAKKLSRNVESLTPKKSFKVTQKQIQGFETIIENSEMTGYCCCPISTYSISFVKNNKELDIFYVDTVEFNNKIRIYEASFQYSYIIEKQKWKSFLDKVEE